MSGDVCGEHGSTRGRQTVKVIATYEAPYPRVGLDEAEGDASEVECPYCGLANDLADEDGTVRPGGFECGHCGDWFDVADVTIMVKVRGYPEPEERANG